MLAPAGAEDLLPICARNQAGSLYTQLVVSNKIKIVRSLVGLFSGNITGSRKCDAYVWAVQYIPDILNVTFHDILIL